MKWHRHLSLLLAFVLGTVLGVAGHAVVSGKIAFRGLTGYVERHEGQTGHINPLLACDVAADVLSDSEIVPFKSKVDNYLASRIDRRSATRVSVYFRELNDGHWFSIGDVEKYTPASMRKVPLLIAMLKQAEQDSGLLDRQVPFDLSADYNASQNIKPSKTLVPGKMYSIRELLYRMIVYSDNNAFTLLTKYVDPGQFDMVYNKLHLLNPRAVSDDDFLSVQTYASFFRVLYNASYLSREASDWALDLLSKAEFRTGLVAGVPPVIEVAHKFGEKSDAASGTVQLHDCGIVYYPRHPYLLCIMSQGPNFEYLDDVIAEISRITFSAIDSQHPLPGSR